jgi:hypothetical protein
MLGYSQLPCLFFQTDEFPNGTVASAHTPAASWMMINAVIVCFIIIMSNVFLSFTACIPV